jgi:hypothetical protein
MSFTGPNFFILGAPKCGTTSLARWLGEHSQVFMSQVKEPHYYSTDLANRSVTSKSGYRRLFRGVTDDHRAVGEASTWYLYSREAVPAIERKHPGVRYIVMTRDPVEMAHSLHHHNLRVLHEDRTSFEEAWALQEERALGRAIPKTCTEPAFLQYKAACSLGSLLERLYGRVEEARVLHIRLEDLKADPAGEYRRVQEFLGIPDEGRNTFPAANEARGHRSAAVQMLLRLGGRARVALGISRGLGLGRLNERSQPKAVLSDAFCSELAQAFADERRRLADLNGASV